MRNLQQKHNKLHLIFNKKFYLRKSSFYTSYSTICLDGYYLSDMFDARNGPVRTSPEDDNDYDMLYRIVTY